MSRSRRCRIYASTACRLAHHGKTSPLGRTDCSLNAHGKHSPMHTFQRVHAHGSSVQKILSTKTTTVPYLLSHVDGGSAFLWCAGPVIVGHVCLDALTS